ncbi:Alpha/Beta hydrolase protein [Cyathus striatus]|nr:Alpha/Beta hydrolase protein [Cyathus striatus]
MSSTLPLISLSLLLVLLPPLYKLSTTSSEPLYVHPGLSSLPRTSKSWEVYPEDFYEGGSYVRLPWGRVRYWVLGPEDGRKIVLIHGLTIPAIVWKGVATALAKKGYRVLVYDLYGRGYSDAPRMTYHTALYTTQLALLMQYLKWDRAIIVGFSMGGGIAAAFTTQFPQLVDENVVLIASAGIMEPLSTTARFLSSPILQSVLSSVPLMSYFINILSPTKTTEDESTVPPIIEIVRLQSSLLPYYNTAISSSLRDGPIRGESKSFSSDEMIGRKVLILQGDRDRIVAPHYARKIHALLPPVTRERSEVVVVPGAGHDLTVTHAGEVVGHITSFVEKGVR